MMDGDCHYYHYMQGGFDDKGWGCAYRSLQTIISWLQLQHYAPLKPVPTHKELQRVIQDMGAAPSADFVGSKQWIGSQEVGWILNQLFGIDSKFELSQNVTELMSKGAAIAHHFRTQGTPIMMGASRSPSPPIAPTPRSHPPICHTRIAAVAYSHPLRLPPSLPFSPSSHPLRTTCSGGVLGLHDCRGGIQ